jgi:hypothetical protein
MAEHMNKKSTSRKFVVSQLKDTEQRLKKDYSATLVKKLFWLGLIDEKWDDLSENLQKFKFKPFPYYGDL